MCKNLHVTEDSDGEADGSGYVIVSFTVITASPIEGLSQYLSKPRARPDEFVYELGTQTFEEPESEARADQLDATINRFLDLLEPIPRGVLHDPNTFVRLYATFCRGAETISSTTLKRLAGVNATIWIDA